MTQTETIARDFARRVRAYVGTKTLAKINELNAAEADSSICHSHDFCDPNQAMIRALDAAGLDWSEDSEILNTAWALAKLKNFYAPKPREPREPRMRRDGRA